MILDLVTFRKAEYLIAIILTQRLSLVVHIKNLLQLIIKLIFSFLYFLCGALGDLDCKPNCNKTAFLVVLIMGLKY